MMEPCFQPIVTDVTKLKRNKYECRITNCVSPALIYVAVVNDKEKYDNMNVQMYHYYSTRKNKLRNTEPWKKGDYCVVNGEWDKMVRYRRASIVELIGEDKAHVFYTDFGIEEIVPFKNMYTIHQRLSRMGAFTAKCHLGDIVPSCGTEWPSLTSDYLRVLVAPYRKIQIELLGPHVNGSLPVAVWAYHTLNGAAFERDIKEWRCVSHKLVQQGVAIPLIQNTCNRMMQEPTNVRYNLTEYLRVWIVGTVKLKAGPIADASEQLPLRRKSASYSRINPTTRFDLPKQKFYFKVPKFGSRRQMQPSLHSVPWPYYNTGSSI